MRKPLIFNKAFKMKVGWGILSQSYALWVWVLVSKYKINLDKLMVRNIYVFSLVLWQGVHEVWGDVLKGIVWAIGNGQRIRF